MAEPSYYELLEVAPKASREEIQVAYNRSRAAFAQNSLAVYSLFSAEECAQMQQRIEEAYRTLMNDDTRRRYDASLGLAAAPGARPTPPSLRPPIAERPPAIPVRPIAPAPRSIDAPRGVTGANGVNGIHTPAPAPAPVDDLLPEGAVITGALLRKVRERRGISLRDIAQVSKVSLTYLQFIEEENFSQLPVPAYLRGFLKAYAKQVGLDPERVAGEYIKLYALYHEIKGG